MLADPSLADLLSQHISARLQKAANRLMRIDDLLARSEASAVRQANFVGSRPSATPLDRILGVQ
jgi:hypothetical protein